MRRSVLSILATTCGGAVLVVSLIATASAAQPSATISKSRLANMGLSGMQSMSDSAGRQVRGNRALFRRSGALGIPLDSVGRTRLVALLNWSYQPAFSGIPAVVWRHLRETRELPEPLPPARREF